MNANVEVKRALKRAAGVMASYRMSEHEVEEVAADVLADFLHLTGGKLDLVAVVRRAQRNYSSEVANADK